MLASQTSCPVLAFLTSLNHLGTGRTDACLGVVVLLAERAVARSSLAGQAEIGPIAAGKTLPLRAEVVGFRRALGALPVDCALQAMAQVAAAHALLEGAVEVLVIGALITSSIAFALEASRYAGQTVMRLQHFLPNKIAIHAFQAVRPILTFVAVTYANLANL